jgi:hypothetical protein
VRQAQRFQGQPDQKSGQKSISSIFDPIFDPVDLEIFELASLTSG